MEPETAFHLVAGLFIWLLGLCVGSFLNVVIYRLPRGLSVSKPRRSFCPSCREPIQWHDNIPVLSWLMLRGRCRRCSNHISVQYPIIEALTGVTFVLIYHLLVVVDARVGMQIVGLSDAPLVAAWLVLAAAMIACSAMDLTAYIIDVRVTDVCMVAGILLYALWPNADVTAGTSASPISAAAAAAFVASGVMLYLTVWRRGGDETDADEETENLDSRAQADNSKRTTSMLAAYIPLMIFVCLAIWLIAAPLLGDSAGPGIGKMAVPSTLLIIFAAIVIAGGQHRDADQEINDAIEQESPRARRVALAELLWLTPSILAGIAVYILLTYLPAARDGWAAAVAWKIGSLHPIGGASYAVLGAMVGAAAGWTLRLVFTLAFGREAFGTGDIYILAAAGAAGGWDIALVGLVPLSVVLALAGWMIQLLLKSSGMIPFGPWLGLGFLTALWLNRTMAEIGGGYRDAVVATWDQSPRALVVAGAILMAGGIIAVVLARLLRVWLESRADPDPD